MSVSTAPVPVLVKTTTSPVVPTSTVSDGDLKKAVDTACNLLSNLESAMHEVRKLSSARHAYSMNRKFGHFQVRLVRAGGKHRIQISLGGHKWVGFRELKSSHPSIQTVALVLVANQQNRIEDVIERLEEARQKKVAQRKELSDMVKEIRANDALSVAVDLLLDTKSTPSRLRWSRPPFRLRHPSRVPSCRARVTARSRS